MEVAYVSGPYRDRRGLRYVLQHITAAHAVAAELWDMGFAVICPHANSFMMDQVDTPDDRWLSGDITLAWRSDLMVMLPTWRASAGACAERSAMFDQNKPVYEWPRDKDVLRLRGKQNPEPPRPGNFTQLPAKVRVTYDGCDELMNVVNIDGDMVVLSRKSR